MNERLKKALKRQSEIREALNASVGKKAGQDGHLTDEKRAELQSESVKLEAEIRAAIDEPDPRDADANFRSLADRIEARHYINAAINDRAVDGAEAEFSKELGLDVRNVMPWAAVEDRQDMPTQVPESATGQPRQPLLRRVFHRTDAAFVGAVFPSVPRGTPVYPVMTGGAEGGMFVPGAAVEAEEATLEGQNVSPKRASARYLIRAEDAAKFDGLESTLRSDLRIVMGQLIDAQAVAGDGAGANLAGFLSHASAGAAAGAEVITLADIDMHISRGIDGLYANEASALRFMIGTETDRILRTVRPFAAAGGSAMSLDEFWRANVGGLRVSRHVGGVTGNVQKAYRWTPNGLRFIVPVWEGVELIRDPYSGAAKGEVALTVIALYGALMVRNNGLATINIRLAK